MTSPRRIVFYRTLAINHDARSGSALRPAKLLRSFEELGYEVDVVAGHATERKRAVREVKRKIRSGARYDFLYAEPPTTPVLLNDAHHLPSHPLLDYGLLAFCHSHGVPVVLFYCDVQWRLPRYARLIGWPKYLFMLPFFQLDLAVYRRCVDAWLVPEIGMLRYVARWVESKPHWASAPGFDPLEAPPPRSDTHGAPLRLFYVGGVEPPVYDLAPLFRGSALARERGLEHSLTICCREAEWARHRRTYEGFVDDHVRIVHNRTRHELLELYSSHDIAVMPYGTLNSDWAMPIKFAEAIGMGLPVLAGEGTAVARVVAEQGIGWAVGDRPEDLHARLLELDAAELERARAAVARIRPAYAWTERAREIAVIADQVRVPQGDQVARLV